MAHPPLLHCSAKRQGAMRYAGSGFGLEIGAAADVPGPEKSAY